MILLCQLTKQSHQKYSGKESLPLPLSYLLLFFLLGFTGFLSASLKKAQILAIRKI